MAHLGAERFAALPFPLPPLAEQHRIVAEVERRLSVIQAVEGAVAANLETREALRQAILRRAFEGKLVPQDPNDEPASVLLEPDPHGACAVGDSSSPAREGAARANAAAGAVGAKFEHVLARKVPRPIGRSVREGPPHPASPPIWGERGRDGPVGGRIGAIAGAACARGKPVAPRALPVSRRPRPSAAAARCAPKVPPRLGETWQAQRAGGGPPRTWQAQRAG